MKKFTLLVVFLLMITMLSSDFVFGGERNGSRSEVRRTIPIESMDIVSGNTPVPFLTPLSESFESTTFPPTGWSKVSIPNNLGWVRITLGTTPLPGWNGGTATVPAGGGSATAYVTYGLVGISNDEWLITPQITNVQPNDSLYFWLRKPGYTNGYLDNFDIKISTTTNVPASFTVTVAALVFPVNTADTNWTLRAYRIGNLVSPGASIYIGFREHVANNITDGAAFQLDLVQVTGNPVGISGNNGEIPSEYSLGQNYPNPFNPTTNIKFGLPKSGNVKLAVYDVLGNEVSVIVNEFRQAGSYTADFDASKLSSGIYFYKLSTESFTETKKMMLVK
jgi:hypothetical protein